MANHQWIVRGPARAGRQWDPRRVAVSLRHDPLLDRTKATSTYKLPQETTPRKRQAHQWPALRGYRAHASLRHRALRSVGCPREFRVEVASVLQLNMPFGSAKDARKACSIATRKRPPHEIPWDI